MFVVTEAARWQRLFEISDMRGPVVECRVSACVGAGETRLLTLIVDFPTPVDPRSNRVLHTPRQQLDSADNQDVR